MNTSHHYSFLSEKGQRIPGMSITCKKKCTRNIGLSNNSLFFLSVIILTCSLVPLSCLIKLEIYQTSSDNAIPNGSLLENIINSSSSSFY